MNASFIPKFGGADVLEIQPVPEPGPVAGEVLIKVHAFGVNHAEMPMRKGERDEWNPISGLECVDVRREESQLLKQFNGPPRFDKVLTLIGNWVLAESINITHPGGRMLQAGWLSGLAPVVDFNPVVEMASGVHFSILHSKTLGEPDFPLSGIPLQEIITKIENGAWDAEHIYVIDDKDIQSAHRMLDSPAAGGMIVVKHCRDGKEKQN